MNTFKVRAFGITRELMGGKQASVDVNGHTVADLRNALAIRFPQLSALTSLYIAVNNDYATEDQVLGPDDEIALIPPVSGG